MPAADILKAAESDLAAFVSLPGEIRGKVKAGLAELTAIRDEVDSFVAAETARARDTLAKLKAAAAAADADLAAKSA